jgi:hypothetical protein
LTAGKGRAGDGNWTRATSSHAGSLAARTQSPRIQQHPKARKMPSSSCSIAALDLAPSPRCLAMKRASARSSCRVSGPGTKPVAVSHRAPSREGRHPSRQIANFPGQPVPAEEPHPARIDMAGQGHTGKPASTDVSAWRGALLPIDQPGRADDENPPGTIGKRGRRSMTASAPGCVGPAHVSL